MGCRLATNAPRSLNEEEMLNPSDSTRVIRPGAAARFRCLAGVASFLIAYAFCAAQARAHEIGLSVVEIQVEPVSLSVQLTFAQREVESLISADSKAQGSLPSQAPGDWAAWEALAFKALEITLDERHLKAGEVAIQPEPNNTIKFRLTFPKAGGSGGSRLLVRSILP